MRPIDMRFVRDSSVLGIATLRFQPVDLVFSGQDSIYNYASIPIPRGLINVSSAGPIRCVSFELMRLLLPPSVYLDLPHTSSFRFRSSPVPMLTPPGLVRPRPPLRRCPSSRAPTPRSLAASCAATARQRPNSPRTAAPRGCRTLMWNPPRARCSGARALRSPAGNRDARKPIQ